MDFEVELLTSSVFFACGKGKGFKKGVVRLLCVAWVSGKDIETETEDIINYWFGLKSVCEGWILVVEEIGREVENGDFLDDVEDILLVIGDKVILKKCDFFEST